MFIAFSVVLRYYKQQNGEGEQQITLLQNLRNEKLSRRLTLKYYILWCKMFSLKACIVYMHFLKQRQADAMRNTDLVFPKRVLLLFLNRLQYIIMTLCKNIFILTYHSYCDFTTCANIMGGI